MCMQQLVKLPMLTTCRQPKVAVWTSSCPETKRRALASSQPRNLLDLALNVLTSFYSNRASYTPDKLEKVIEVPRIE
jgi:hypothetical protein